MTLVLTCVSREYIVQVSDRRLTSALDPNKVHAEDANKAVFVDGRSIFCFTGLARLAGLKADIWLANRLVKSKGPISARLQELMPELPSAVSYAPPEFRSMSLVGVGFGRANNGPIGPLGVQISNYLDARGNPRGVIGDFEMTFSTLSPRLDFHIVETGIKLYERERGYLYRNIRRARNNGVGPREIARILAEVVWRVSKIENTVGENLMVCVLPFGAIRDSENVGISAGTPFLPDRPSFHYVGPETQQGVVFGPTIVGGGTVLSNIRVTYGSIPKWIEEIHFQGPGGGQTLADAPCPCGSGNSYRGCHGGG